MISLDVVKDAKIKNIIFVSEGGIGKVIASTAVVKRLNEEFPEKRIIVVTGYPDIFLNNPRVYKVFNFGNPLYFYDDYVTPESFLIKVEPYSTYEYTQGGQHLIKVWCDMIGISSEGAVPEIYFLDNELEAGKIYVDKLTGNGKKKFIILQWVGGIVPNDKKPEAQFDAVMRMHRRSLPKNVAQKLANKFMSRDFVVGVLQHENHPDLQNVERLFFPNVPPRNVIALLKYSQGFVGIDSLLQHAGMAMGIKGVVCWGGTSPKKLGYDIHKNITRSACPKPFCHRPDSYNFDSSPHAGIWNCPYNQKCMEFDADEIINAYEELYKENKKEEIGDVKNELLPK